MSNRNLSFDLLRIIAMLLVLVVHTIGIIGVPTAESFRNDLITSISLSCFYFISSGCVNLFILLSGWFGMTFSINKLANLFFQVTFWNVIATIVYLCISHDYSGIDILNIFSLNDSLWFFLSYLCLYILAPVLNGFVENSSKNDIKRVILFFFAFQTIWCWMFKAASFFMQGYSPLSFIGLYLLARYVRLYPSRFSGLHCKYDILIYVLLVVFSVSVVTIAALKGVFISRMFSYISPFLILSCLFLLQFFSKIEVAFGKNPILFLAPSAFAVYVFHVNGLIYPYFSKFVLYVHTHSNILVIYCFLILLFITVSVVDRTRIFIWNKIINKIH